jgi:hypothetical protein
MQSCIMTIDFYESSKNILGQGAGARKGGSMKKKALYQVDRYEDWYMNFKCTPYEDEAYMLLNEMIDSYSVPEDPMLTHLREQRSSIELQMNKLDIERLRMKPKADVEVVVKLSNTPLVKKSYHMSDEIKDYLEKFDGCELEPEAIRLCREYISVYKQLEELEKKEFQKYEFQDDIQERMDALTMRKLENDTMDSISPMVDLGDMGQGLMDLMHNVDMNDFQEPIVDPFPSIMAKEYEKSDIEDRSNYSVEELGKDREDLDPALVEDLIKFECGQKVSLSKEFVRNSWYGEAGVSIPSGTSGVVDNAFDEHGDYYTVFFEGFGMTRVPASYLK